MALDLPRFYRAANPSRPLKVAQSEDRRYYIDFSSVRGGDIVGELDVLFAAAGERIVLRHIATDRAIFARGALKAALWGQDKSPGEYDMMDVLGI